MRVVAVVAFAALGYLLFVRARGPDEIAPSAIAAARAAGCGELEQPVEPDPFRTHLPPGDTYVYPDRPAAAGPHAADPLPPEPHVYRRPIPEARAVHNLEHAYVVVYYRPSDQGGPPAATVSALERYATDQDRVIVAPYPDLPDDRGLALQAWDTRWMCPSTTTPQQAVTIARGFVDAFRGTTVAPEAPRGWLGPLFQP